ncbi:MAG: dihydroorotase [candidate division WOR-3 bacterium]|uniref:Dihydroorotase n=2 Tax=candidate division WOR-3 bacterium TaxID=2052148 RepID=A0A7C3IUD6_UNCW3|nr:dihydroorotase [candidate division WOR-3 bacterium]
MNSMVFVGGSIIDPEAGKIRRADVLVENGVIREVGTRVRRDGAQVIDCRNRYLAPGFIDLHCHLREPGEEIKETIASGCWSAFASGFTQICPMPNTTPAIDSEALIRFEQEAAAAARAARIVPVGTMTKSRQGRELAELGSMAQAGARAVSDDGSWVSDAGLMRRIMEYATTFNLLVMSHCEVPELVAGPADEGEVATRLGLRGAPGQAEAIAAMRDIMLAELTNARLHICHVSSRLTVEVLRWGKARGIAVTAETCPHYFTLTSELLADYDPDLRVNPPLRSESDRKAIVKALKDGTIDCIATDHAPHSAEEKEREFEAAAPGIIGFETAFSLAYEQLVLKRVLTLPELIARLTVVPATILGIEPPAIKPGVEANLVVIDTELKWELTRARIYSRSYNTPFLGRMLRGRVVASVLGNNRHFDPEFLKI